MRAAFCAYILGLYFTGVSLPAQKLCVEQWWNWALESYIFKDLKIFIQPCANFTNISRAAFALMFLRQKSINLRCKNKKAACETFVHKSSVLMLVTVHICHMWRQAVLMWQQTQFFSLNLLFFAILRTVNKMYNLKI